jgi:hypothetical protein
MTESNSQSISYDLIRELRSFGKWMENEHICITAKDGTLMKGSSLNQLFMPEFEEPNKNKLLAFMKTVAKNYVLKKDGKALKKTEAPKLVKQFKAAKILIDSDIDTSNTGYLITLDYSMDELEKAFGNPVYNTVADDKWSKEWKILINGHPYSIYDWKNGKDCHLAGEKKNKKDMNLLEEHLKRFKMDVGEEPLKKTTEPVVPTNLENELKKQMEDDFKKESLEQEFIMDPNAEDDIVFDDILDGLDELDEEAHLDTEEGDAQCDTEDVECE